MPRESIAIVSQAVRVVKSKMYEMVIELHFRSVVAYTVVTGGDLVSTGQLGLPCGVPRLIGWPRKKPITLELLNRNSHWLRK